jgi:hypothetical protein
MSMAKTQGNSPEFRVLRYHLTRAFRYGETGEYEKLKAIQHCIDGILIDLEDYSLKIKFHEYEDN